MPLIPREGGKEGRGKEARGESRGGQVRTRWSHGSRMERCQEADAIPYGRHVAFEGGWKRLQEGGWMERRVEGGNGLEEDEYDRR